MHPHHDLFVFVVPLAYHVGKINFGRCRFLRSRLLLYRGRGFLFLVLITDQFHYVGAELEELINITRYKGSESARRRLGKSDG